MNSAPENDTDAIARHVRVLKELTAQPSSDPDVLEARQTNQRYADELEAVNAALPHYDVLRWVREGGQGVIYHARHLPTQRLVAIKVLSEGPVASEARRRRFEREIDVIAGLDHPGIVTLYDCGVVGRQLYYSMEYVEGARIDHHVLLKQLGPREIVRLMLAVCEAIHHAHQNGVIHRDLNPANILVDRERRPRIVDFGLAAVVAGADQGLTSAGHFLGTLPYASPEQLFGAPTDVRCDVYALGLTLYRLLSDSYPYTPKSGSYGDMRAAITSGPVTPLRRAVVATQPLRSVDTDLECIVARAIERFPQDRYGSVAELSADLSRWLRGDAVLARSGFWYQALKAAKRHRIAAGFAATILVSALAAAGGVTAAWLEAERERERATRAAEDAQQAEDQASRAARTAYRMFALAMDEVEDEVRRLPGGVQLSNELLQRLSEELPEFGELLQYSSAFDDLQVDLIERQADSAILQARFEEARPLCELLLDLRLSQWEAGPAAALCARTLDAYRKLASTLAEPRETFEAGLRFGEEQLTDFTGDDSLLLALGRLYASFGRWSWRMAEYEESAGVLECALRLLTPLQREGLLDPAVEAGVSQTSIELGTAYFQLDNALEGAAFIEQGTRSFERLVVAQPADMMARYGLLTAYARWGDVVRQRGEREAATEYYAAAAAEGEKLLELEPQARLYNDELFGVYHELIELCLDSGNTIEASRSLSRAEVCIERVEAGREFLARVRGALLTKLRGRILYVERRYEESALAFAEALRECELIHAADAENTRYLEYLASANYFLGSALSKYSPREAPSFYEAALAHREDILERTQTADAKRELARISVNVTAPWLRIRDDSHALEAARRALDRATAFLNAFEQQGVFSGHEGLLRQLRTSLDDNHRIVRRRLGPE